MIRVGEQVYPSVTEIITAVGLSDFNGIPDHLRQRGLARGRALHRAIEWHHAGTLDEATLHSEIEPGFRAYRKFLAETGHEAIASEVRLVHPTWGYCGKPDRIGWLNGRRVLFDWKFSDSVNKRLAALQVAGGYYPLWNAVHPDARVEACSVLELHKDGTYRLVDVTDPGAEQVFLAALIVYRARIDLGLVIPILREEEDAS